MIPRRSLSALAVGSIVALLLVPYGVWGDEPAPTGSRLKEVAVSAEDQRTTVVIKTAGSPTYRTEVMDSPARLVIDFDDTTYGWQKTPLAVTTSPVKQIRGSQYRKGVARLVVELTRPAQHVIRQEDDSIVIVFPAPTARAVPAAAPTPAPPRTPPPTRTVAAPPAMVATGAVAEAPPAVVPRPDLPKLEPPKPEAAPIVSPRPPASPAAVVPAPRAKEAGLVFPPPVMVAQAQTAPTPVQTGPGGQ